MFYVAAYVGDGGTMDPYVNSSMISCVVPLEQCCGYTILELQYCKEYKKLKWFSKNLKIHEIENRKV